MDKFPDVFNRKVCNETMEKNQSELIKKVRNEFHQSVLNTINDCDSVATLEFPEKLWHVHRVTLIKELLERFGKVKIQTSNAHCYVTKLITLPEDIPNFVTKVLVEFIKEN